MKHSKTAILGAALLAISGAAGAQSSVTLYGRLNLSVEHLNVGSASTNRVADNASRIGFKGIEDLGGGLKAGFVLEHGFNANNGTQAGITLDPNTFEIKNGAFWNRGSEVFLQGNWGMVRLGHFLPESYLATADYVSMHNHDNGASADAFYYDANGFQYANKIAYRTPNLGGFWGEIAVQEAGQGYGGERGYDLALNYNTGGLHIGGGYSANGDFKQAAISASYEFGNFTLGGYVQHGGDVFYVKQQLPLPNQPISYYMGKRTSYRLAGMYRMGATEFHLNYGFAGNIDSQDKTNSHQITAMVNHNLSKRTKVYGYYTMIGDDEILRVYTPGKWNAYGVGIRHNF